MHVKTAPPDRLDREWRALSALSLLGDVTTFAPHPLERGEARAWIATEQIHGTTLRRLEGRALVDAFARVGAALRWLRSCGAAAPDLAARPWLGLAALRAADLSSMCEPALDFVASLHRDQALQGALAQIDAGTEDFVHGDLHLDNVVDNGARAVLVDWEMAGAGDARWDIAMLVADLLAEALTRTWRGDDRAAVRALVASSGVTVDDSLARLTGAALLLRGVAVAQTGASVDRGRRLRTAGRNLVIDSTRGKGLFS